MEIECFKLLIDGIRRADFADRAVDLQVVVVNDHAQVVQFVESCEHGSFPDLAFFDLTVSEECIHSPCLVRKLCGKRHSDRRADALSQRSRTHIRTRNFLHTRMALQIRSQMAQSRKILYRKISPVCKRTVKTRRSMAFGKDKSVAVRFLRVLRVDVHLLKIKVGEHVCCGQRSARVPCLGTMNCGNDALANFIRHLL